MASDTSGKAKLGTLIALLGGTIGTGIVIYALMGKDIDDEPKPIEMARNEASEAEPEANADTPDAEPAKAQEPVRVDEDATPSDAVAEPETAASNEDTEVDASQKADKVEENAPDQPTQTEPETTLDNGSTVDAEEGAQSDQASVISTDSSVEPASETERKDDAAPAEDVGSEGQTAQNDTVAGDADTQAEINDTEMASVAPSEPETPTQDTVPEAKPEPATTQTTSVDEAPSVTSDDPVMGAAEPVILQTAPEPSDAAPVLDPNDPAVPKFDLVRIESDGSAVIAGRASPNSDVEILSNGVPIGTARASSRGEFVALIDTQVSSTAQSLALIANNASGDRISSQSNVIVLGRSTSEIDNSNEEISLAPAIVQATPDAVRVIQPVVGLADLDRVSLDTISYDESGQVILAGRGRPGFKARIYADGTSLSDHDISGSGTWSATINDLDAGRYVIRVDEIDPDGKVASRVESPFQRIFPTAEQLALLTDATSVIVQPGNNLWTIAEGRYGEGFRYTTIFEANKEQIRDPDLIYPGQVFELPKGGAE